jgi:type IV pilus assembly protein PilF
MWLPKALLASALCAALAGCGGGAAVSDVGRGETRSTARSSADPAKPSKKRAVEVQLELGRSYMDRGQLETAHEAFKKALALDPSSVDGNTLMAVLYERIDRAEGAEKYYRRAVELDAEDGATNNNYGAFLCRLGRYAEADKYFVRALDDPFYKTPQSAFANAGVCARLGGDAAKAEGYFRKAVEADPRNAGALYELARLTFDKQDFLRARGFMQRLESISPPDAAALELAARIEERLGDAGAAAKYRERLKTEFPDYEPGTVTGEDKSP